MNDLRFAFHQLLKNPGFTAMAVLVLTAALGCGCRTVIGTSGDMKSHANAAPPGSVNMPFELFCNNILIPVRLNGSEPASFIFDTGASVTVVDKQWASVQGLIVEGGVKLNAGGGVVEGGFAKGVNLALPGLEGTNQLLALVALDQLQPLFGRSIRGILGNSFLKDYVIEINHTSRTLIFHSPHRRSLANEPRALPIENRGGIPFVELTLSLDDSEPFAGWFEIDSGSSGSLNINRPFAGHHQILNRVPGHLQAEGVGGAGLGGDMKSIDVRIRAIQLGGHRLKDPIVSLSEDETGVGAGADGGFLGEEVLRRFTVVLDYRSKRVLLTPNAAFGEPFRVDLSGMELMTAPDDFNEIRIKRVREGFPAARVGLRPGDVILSINGQRARNLNLDEWTKLLKQPGRRCTLKVRRGGNTIHAQFELRQHL